MKTLVLSKKELDSLPKEVQESIMEVYTKRETSIKQIKERIKELKEKSFDYRSDIGEVNTSEGEDELFFDIWEKSAGEQWGNCFGRKYKFNIGRKYISVDIEFYRTNAAGRVETKNISEAKMVEILDLIEQNQDSVDFDKYIAIAANRITDYFRPW